MLMGISHPEETLMPRHHTLSLVIVALALAACSGPAGSTPVESATATFSPAADPPTPVAATDPAPAAAEPTAASQPASGDDIRAYKIAPDESTVSYSVNEVLIREGNKFNVAVGVTSAVEGEITLNFTHPELSTVGTITVDISTFKSDSDRRDRAIQRDWLESAKFPTATFTPTGVTGVPASAKEGDEITFQITGDLLVRDTTRPVTWDVTAKLDGGALTGAATTAILMSDFNFSAPDIAGILKAEDEARLEFKFVARP